MNWARHQCTWCTSWGSRKLTRTWPLRFTVLQCNTVTRAGLDSSARILQMTLRWTHLIFMHLHLKVFFRCWQCLQCPCFSSLSFHKTGWVICRGGSQTGAQERCHAVTEIRLTVDSRDSVHLGKGVTWSDVWSSTICYSLTECYIVTEEEKIKKEKPSLDVLSSHSPRAWVKQKLFLARLQRSQLTGWATIHLFPREQLNRHKVDMLPGSWNSWPEQTSCLHNGATFMLSVHLQSRLWQL